MYINQTWKENKIDFGAGVQNHKILFVFLLGIKAERNLAPMSNCEYLSSFKFYDEYIFRNDVFSCMLVWSI